MEAVTVKRKDHPEAFEGGAKKEGSEVEISSLNSHFQLLRTRHKMLGQNSLGRD